MLENFLDRVACPGAAPRFDETLLPPEQRNLLKPYIFKVIEGTDLAGRSLCGNGLHYERRRDGCADRLVYYGLAHEGRDH